MSASQEALPRTPAAAKDPETRKSPATRGFRDMRRRGLEPPPGYPGPGPQPGNPGVISVRCVPDRPYRPGARTIRTHRTIWKLSRMLSRAGTAGCAWRRGEPCGRSARAGAVTGSDRRVTRPLAAAECVAAASPRMQERRGGLSRAGGRPLVVPSGRRRRLRADDRIPVEAALLPDARHQRTARTALRSHRARAARGTRRRPGPPRGRLNVAAGAPDVRSRESRSAFAGEQAGGAGPAASMAIAAGRCVVRWSLARMLRLRPCRDQQAPVGRAGAATHPPRLPRPAGSAAPGASAARGRAAPAAPRRRGSPRAGRAAHAGGGSLSAHG
jgi:hypothetical protein